MKLKLKNREKSMKQRAVSLNRSIKFCNFWQGWQLKKTQAIMIIDEAVDITDPAPS